MKLPLSKSGPSGVMSLPPRNPRSSVGSIFIFFSSRRRHTRLQGDWSSDVCSSDLVFFMADRSLMVLSDHLGPGLLWVDWKERRVVSETKLGQQPFHTTYDPEGDRLDRKSVV